MFVFVLFVFKLFAISTEKTDSESTQCLEHCVSSTHSDVIIYC